MRAKLTELSHNHVYQPLQPRWWDSGQQTVPVRRVDEQLKHISLGAHGKHTHTHACTHTVIGNGFLVNPTRQRAPAFLSRLQRLWKTNQIISYFHVKPLQRASGDHTHLLEWWVRSKWLRSCQLATHPYLVELSFSSGRFVTQGWYTCLSQYEVQQGKQETVKAPSCQTLRMAKGSWEGLGRIWLLLSIQALSEENKGFRPYLKSRH